MFREKSLSKRAEEAIQFMCELREKAETTARECRELKDEIDHELECLKILSDIVSKNILMADRLVYEMFDGGAS